MRPFGKGICRGLHGDSPIGPTGSLALAGDLALAAGRAAAAGGALGLVAEGALAGLRLAGHPPGRLAAVAGRALCPARCSWRTTMSVQTALAGLFTVLGDRLVSSKSDLDLHR